MRNPKKHVYVTAMSIPKCVEYLLGDTDTRMSSESFFCQHPSFSIWVRSFLICGRACTAGAQTPLIRTETIKFNPNHDTHLMKKCLSDTVLTATSAACSRYPRYILGVTYRRQNGGRAHIDLKMGDKESNRNCLLLLLLLLRTKYITKTESSRTLFPPFCHRQFSLVQALPYLLKKFGDTQKH
jgi:hypothetical protein